MATYATYAELVQRYGLIELGKMDPSDATDTLEVLATQALVEAAGEIDSALKSGGFVVPVDTSASAITDTDQRARTIALLRRLEIGIAVGAFSRETYDRAQSMGDGQGKVTFKTRVLDDMTWARAFLDCLRKGTEALPGLDSPGSSFVIVSEAAVPSKDDVDDRFAAAGGW